MKTYLLLPPNKVAEREAVEELLIFLAPDEVFKRLKEALEIEEPIELGKLLNAYLGEARS
jgi:hypothetical protein